MNNDLVNNNKTTLTIWGRDLELQIVFDCFDNEEISALQKETLKELLSTPDMFEKAKPLVISYCLKKHGHQIEGKTIDNIFKYVRPKSIYIKRTRDNSKVAGLLCDYKFDIEHGIAVAFKNHEVIRIGEQDIIL